MKLDASDIADLRPLIAEAVRATVEELTRNGRLGPQRGAANEPTPLLMTVAECAKALRVSTRTVSNLAKSGAIKPVRVGERGGGLRIDRRSVQDWIERQGAAATRTQAAET